MNPLFLPSSPKTLLEVQDRLQSQGDAIGEQFTEFTRVISSACIHPGVMATALGMAISDTVPAENTAHFLEVLIASLRVARECERELVAREASTRTPISA